MKTLNIVLKVLSALATIAGIVYLVATYGDQIVAWAKKMMAKCPCMCDAEEEAPAEEAVTEVAEEAPAEEAAPAEEEAPAVEAAPAVEDTAPVADEEDFEA